MMKNLAHFRLFRKFSSTPTSFSSFLFRKSPTIACNRSFHSSILAQARNYGKRSLYFLPKADSLLKPGSMKGKVVFISMGNFGLGKELALHFSELGAKVVVGTKENLSEKEKTSFKKETKRPQDFHVYTANPLDIDVFDQVLSTIQTEVGLPDIVINHHVGHFVGPTEKLSCRSFLATLHYLLSSTTNATLLLGKRLIEAEKTACFLNFSSTYAKNGSGFVVPSAVAKSGIETLTKSLSAEWSKYGLRFVCIALGPSETERESISSIDPYLQASLVRKTAAGREGEYAEIVNLSSYLVSDYATWMNGSVITFDGGETCVAGGPFNPLIRVSDEQWHQMEAMAKREWISKQQQKAENNENE